MSLEKQRKHEDQTSDEGGFGGPFDGGSKNNMATFKYGQYMEKLPIAGMKAGEVRKKYKSTYNVHDQSVIVINKKQVDDNTVVQEGQTITFIHKSGEKGV